MIRIRIGKDLKERLKRMKRSGETYDDLILRLLKVAQALEDEAKGEDVETGGPVHPRGAAMSTVISIRLPEDTVRELNSIAEMEGCSRAGIIRDALLNYLKEHAHCLIAEERSREKDGSATHDRYGGEHEE